MNNKREFRNKIISYMDGYDAASFKEVKKLFTLKFLKSTWIFQTGDAVHGF